MKCSVVVCTFNGERFIGEQLRSILNQSRLPDEIIILDDRSTDSTWQIVEDFRGSFRRAGVGFTAVRNPVNLGVGLNFQSACMCASHDVILMSDQDDRWSHDRVAKTMLHFEADPRLTFLNSDAHIIDANGDRRGVRILDELQVSEAERNGLVTGDWSSFISNRNLATGATIAFSRTLLDVALPFDSRFVHDDWIASLAWLTGKVTFVAEALIDYRLHLRNLIGLHNAAGSVARAGSDGRLEHLNWQITRLRPLIERLREHGLTQLPNAAWTDGLYTHLRARRKILRARIPARLMLLPKEALSGRYRQYSHGIRSMIADLLADGHAAS